MSGAESQFRLAVLSGFSMSVICRLMSYLDAALATSSPARFFMMYSVSCFFAVGGGMVRHGGGTCEN